MLSHIVTLANQLVSVTQAVSTTIVTASDAATKLATGLESKAQAFEHSAKLSSAVDMAAASVEANIKLAKLNDKAKQSDSSLETALKVANTIDPSDLIGSLVKAESIRVNGSTKK